ncbi:transposable element Tc1 transposase [Trichonephila clavipes]|nr:transposable element Tc1 transposase [Trichonephila clavipes]
MVRGLPTLFPFHQPHERTCGSTAIYSTPYPEGTIHLQTSMSSPGFELRLYGTGKSTAETHWFLIETYGVSETTNRDWFQSFKNNDFELEDKEHFRASKKFEDKELEKLLEQNSSKWNRRETSTLVTSMVTASIGKAISAATVRPRLHMNGLYARVPRVCLRLSVQSRGVRLKWCREHGDWTLSDWGNVMFIDESRFALEPDDKRMRIWCKQGTCNQLQNITHSEVEAL